MRLTLAKLAAIVGLAYLTALTLRLNVLLAWLRFKVAAQEIWRVRP